VSDNESRDVKRVAAVTTAVSQATDEQPLAQAKKAPKATAASSASAATAAGTKKQWLVLEPGKEARYETRAGAKDRLQQLQKLVGGYITTIPGRVNGTVVVLNEDGFVADLPQNDRVVEHASPQYGCYGLFYGTAVVGKEAWLN